MKKIAAALCSVLVIALQLASTAEAAILEVPANGGDASGIGYFSGWKCPPNDDVTIVLDGGAPLPVPSRSRRLDTAGVCGNDGRNGYIAQYNFSLLGDGLHTASVRQNGVPFAQATFNVTTFGVTFLTGAGGAYVLSNFPQAGRTTTIEWVQGAQNFVIVDTSGGPTSSAQVRFHNDLTCNGFDFTSTLSANGFVWSAFTGSYSPYQTVNRTSLGPFTETNSTPCGDITYPFTLPLTPGRRHALVQIFEDGGPFLAIEDEGPAMLASEPAAQEPTTGSDPTGAAPTVMLPGFAAEGTGTFSSAR